MKPKHRINSRVVSQVDGLPCVVKGYVKVGETAFVVVEVHGYQRAFLMYPDEVEVIP